jgi:polyferredoxin
MPAAETSTNRKKADHKFTKLVLARKFIQFLTLILFIIILIAMRRLTWQTDVLNIPLRIDPLITISNLLSSQIFLASSSISLLLILFSLLLGRAWCGWICPLGTILDVFAFREKKQKELASIPDYWRNGKYFLLFIILFAALLGNLSLLFLDPLTIMVRTITITILPAADRIITSLEYGLYWIPGFSGPISWLDSFLRPGFFPYGSPFYRGIVFYSLFFIGIISLNIVASRFWCRYLCPLGGLLGLLSKFALFRRQVKEDCIACGFCERRCPTRTINPTQKYKSDPSECTMCLECFSGCAHSTIRKVHVYKMVEWFTYDPDRRKILISLGITIAGIGVLRSDWRQKNSHPKYIPPPGAKENNLIGKCVRCGECVRACPTTAIQPAILEAGIEGMWTPILIPRLGYCDYSCNACGQVCPVQAIPPLPLIEKRKQVIGKAYIDENRCIAWSDHKDCIVCEEMCPVSDKAIKLESVKLNQTAGNFIEVKLPRVYRERCIGCGICEYKCPLSGDAAIRVYTSIETRLT